MKLNDKGAKSQITQFCGFDKLKFNFLSSHKKIACTHIHTYA